MRYILLLILIPWINLSSAQTDSKLDAYLASHRYTLQLDADSAGVAFQGDALPAMLLNTMKDKQLFVYAEGFSHELKLNKLLRRMFMKQFIDHGLKYYFEEAARSWVVDDYLQMDKSITIDEYFRSYTYRGRAFYKKENEVYKTGHYEYIAIDFERSNGFKRTIAMLLSAMSKDKQQQLCQLAPYIKDTSYYFLSPGKFVKFYSEQQSRFYADSNSYKHLMGNLYPYFRYLMSDPEPSSYNNNRNENMAIHVLAQIGEHPDPSEKYVLSIGAGHIMYRDGVTKSTLGHLRDSKQLSGKILVTTLYCEQCHAEDNSGNGWAGYLKDDALRSFEKAANSDIVVFDLTELPAEYKYLAEKNDLLVFARDQY